MKRKFVPGNFDLRIKRSRTGRGVFTFEDIPRGACVIEYTGRPATEAEMQANKGKYLFWTSDSSMIDGNIAGNKARFINHSCAPNCEVDIRKRRVYIFALRNIEAGEELTYDYGDEYFYDHIKPIGCLCTKCAPKINKNRSPMG
jgi:SET domain-containing protein